MYISGLGVDKDIEKAIEQYLKGAADGDVDSQSMLGDIYYNQGKYDYAIKWDKIALENGDKEYAAHRLGLCYAFGNGVQQNSSKAVEYYKIAAENGNYVAQHNLGVCYHKGQGVRQDDVKARYWLTKSADAGYQGAVYTLESLGWQK